MKLTEIMDGLDFTVLRGNADIEIEDIVYDSRKARPGTVFVCMKGAKFDSHTAAKSAVEKGAAAVVCERDVDTGDGDVTVLQVADTRTDLAYMAANYFGHPADQLKKIGVTGSKGKTTTTYMLKQILETAGHKTGLIGSIEALSGNKSLDPGGHTTTPESYEIHRLFREMADDGCEFVVMETSSQSFKMHRTAGITFDVGIFLNIFRDHISPWEHATLEEYLACKSVLMKTSKVGICNFDDPKLPHILMGNNLEELHTFGFNEGADVRCTGYKPIQRPNYMGIEYEVTGEMDLTIRAGSPGKFSVYDSLSAAMAAKHFGIPDSVIVDALDQVKIRGRVEKVQIDAPFSVILDFAHNGIGIANLVAAMKDYDPNHIIAVFGSDGNRTKIRRADAGEILGNTVDFTILTSNCPRDEEVEDIDREIMVGLDRTPGKYIEIVDRRSAIKYAMDHAEPGDVILLIGKGHWDYEEIKGKMYPFDERQVVTELWDELQAEGWAPGR